MTFMLNVVCAALNLICAIVYTSMYSNDRKSKLPLAAAICFWFATLCWTLAAVANAYKW